ncbi:type II toxin-antitoxin system VapC family toxin [Natronogracilivirga saccharolytica]|uniref:type II toxin-antitoxin system VapC family toxin n=1 Tax=Natronogracilivirga saccharolytica TaxID=2812953 RepID=UPI001B31703A|nr:type II toxin-antitoxin system VapC family toxin [Natronogracilivirga saccharolytica]
MNRVLVDTNILIFAIDQDSRFFHQARKILDHPEFVLTTTSKNLSEFLAVVTKPNGYGLSSDVASDILGEIINNLQILFPNQESLDLFKELLYRYRPTGLKVHDFEIISIGLANGVRHFATFNSKDFQIFDEIKLVEL